MHFKLTRPDEQTVDRRLTEKTVEFLGISQNCSVFVHLEQDDAAAAVAVAACSTAM